MKKTIEQLIQGNTAKCQGKQVMTIPAVRRVIKEAMIMAISEIVDNPVTYINDVGIDQIPYGIIDKEAISALKKQIQDQ